MQVGGVYDGAKKHADTKIYVRKCYNIGLRF